jgi:LysM repeat protein
MTFPLRPRPAARTEARSSRTARPVPRHAAAGGSARPALRTVGVPILLAGLVTAGAPGWAAYTIRPGDTLTDIAKRYHTTVAALVRANDLPGNGNLIYAGETLKVPAPPAKPKARSRTVTTIAKHRVVRGDTLIGIAKRYHVTTKAVRDRNHLPRSGMVRLGDVLEIPVTRTVAVAPAPNTFAGRTYPSAVAEAAARNRATLAKRHLPGKAATQRLIVRTAKRVGVDPELALAVAWQESGWNQRKVSVANAIGIMQVVPATGTWMSSVVGRKLDLLDVKDNVLAGVMLLKVLDAQATEAQTIAGYYQGLRSVRERGMFADTKRYVANVQSLKRGFERR